MSIIIDISHQSYLLLEKLATYGIYGKDASEVATRFVDERLQQMLESPKPFGAVYPVVSKLEADARENAPRKAVANPPGAKRKVTKRKYNYKKT
jgi:hypothetical protein